MKKTGMKRTVLCIVVLVMAFCYFNTASMCAKQSIYGKMIYKDVYFRQDRITNMSGKEVDVYAITADLSRGNVKIEAGIPDDTAPLEAGFSQTVLDQALAAKEHGKDVLAAVNADFFNMNDPTVIQPVGITIKDGVELSPYSTSDDYRSFFFGVQNNGVPLIGDRYLFDYAKDTLLDAVGGGPRLIEDGDTLYKENSGVHPRTAVGITEDDKIILVVADGRTEQSHGFSDADTAAYLYSLGAVTALNLDGGGSSTFVLKNKKTGELEKINYPSDGYDRAVGNTIMIVAADGNAYKD